MSGAFFVPVTNVMIHDPEHIAGMATIEQALEGMRARGISSLVVERRDERDEFGLLLVADIAREVIGRNRSLRRTNVYEIMTKPAPAVDAGMNLKYAIRQMARERLTHSIVLHGRELVGLVTLRDLTLRYAEEISRPDEPEG